MDKNVSFYMGVGAGILCGILLIAVIILMTKKKGQICEFDERQIVARGKAFQYGFFTYLVYFASFAVLQSVTKEQYIDNFAGIFIGICIGTVVFAANAIWNDAYLSLQENAKTHIISFTLVGAINLILCFKHVVHQESIEVYITNLACGIMLLLITLIIVIKNYKNKKQEEAV